VAHFHCLHFFQLCFHVSGIHNYQNSTTDGYFM
jgi:hypothetical protein